MALKNSTIPFIVRGSRKEASLIDKFKVLSSPLAKFNILGKQVPTLCVASTGICHRERNEKAD